MNAYQLAGHVANVDFWLDEVVHAFDVLDGYESRFRKLKGVQDQHVSEHNTVVFSLDAPFDSDDSGFFTKPIPPTPLPKAEIKNGRRELLDAAYKFLLRCYRANLITLPPFREYCSKIGTSVDVTDIDRNAK